MSNNLNTKDQMNESLGEAVDDMVFYGVVLLFIFFTKLNHYEIRIIITIIMLNYANDPQS